MRGIKVEIRSDGDNPKWVDGYMANLEEIGKKETESINLINAATGAVEAEWIRPQDFHTRASRFES